MQKASVNLRSFLNESRKRGAKFCSSKQTWWFADRAYLRETKKLAWLYSEFRMAQYLLDNTEYREDIRDLTADCEKVDKDRWDTIKGEAQESFLRWRDKEIENCIKKRQDGNKSPIPEHEDIIRLAESISNREKSGNEIILATGDGHFICYADKIKSDYGITIYNYLK